jgi:hypothetical protein
VPSHKRKKKPKTKKKSVKQPAIYYSDNPVSLKEWQDGKSSPNPRAAQPK